MEPGPDSPEVVRMIVEIPKNSSNKYEYDGELGVFRLDRPCLHELLDGRPCIHRSFRSRSIAHLGGGSEELVSAAQPP